MFTEPPLQCYSVYLGQWPRRSQKDCYFQSPNPATTTRRTVTETHDGLWYFYPLMPPVLRGHKVWTMHKSLFTFSSTGLNNILKISPSLNVAARRSRVAIGSLSYSWQGDLSFWLVRKTNLTYSVTEPQIVLVNSWSNGYWLLCNCDVDIDSTNTL